MSKTQDFWSQWSKYFKRLCSRVPNADCTPYTGNSYITEKIYLLLLGYGAPTNKLCSGLDKILPTHFNVAELWELLWTPSLWLVGHTKANLRGGFLRLTNSQNLSRFEIMNTASLKKCFILQCLPERKQKGRQGRCSRSCCSSTRTSCSSTAEHSERICRRVSVQTRCSWITFGGTTESQVSRRLLWFIAQWNQFS